jgi:hypothetical protein
MAQERNTRAPGSTLELVLKPEWLHVSAMSSLLRVAQASVREVARLHDETRDLFTAPPQPVLLVSVDSSDGSVTLRFIFADGMYLRPLDDVSAEIFPLFMARFSEFLKTLPQPGFWKDSVSGGGMPAYRSEVERRMDQLRMEIRRFEWARLICGSRSVLIEGARMEID